MIYRDTVAITLEQWSSTAFFLGGGLLLASPAHIVLELFMDIPLPSWLVALFILPGLMATLVGLLGLYPLLVDRAPILALAGGVVAGITGTILAVIFGWIIGGAFLSAVLGVVVGTPPAVLFMLLALTMTLGFVLFGVATLRSSSLTRSFGLLLLSFAAPWFVVLATTLVYGSSFPDWLTLAIYGPIPFIMMATAYTLRMKSVATGREDVSADTAAS